MVWYFGVPWGTGSVLWCTVVYCGVLLRTEMDCCVPWCTEVYCGVLRCIGHSTYIQWVAHCIMNKCFHFFLFLSASQHVSPWFPCRCLGRHFGAGSGKDSNTDSCPSARGKRWTCGTGTLQEDHAHCDWQQCPAVPITPPVESGYHPRIPGGGAGRLVE